MAKKDTAATVLGMLSTTGASTRPSGTVPGSEPADDRAPADLADAATPDREHPVRKAADSGSGSAPEPAPPATAPRLTGAPRRRAAAPTSEPPAQAVPRTLRLRASTAAALRDAWLDAKRDDVLLSHQDFASDLLDAALRRRNTSR